MKIWYIEKIQQNSEANDIESSFDAGLTNELVDRS